jgi:hypothetical protein
MRLGLPVAVCVFQLVFLTAVVDLMVTHREMGDFGKFYYAARGFLEGRDLYQSTVATFAPASEVEYFDLNPPHFHLVILPLAALPARAALAVWAALGLLAFAWSLRLIVGATRLTLPARRWLDLAAVLLAFPGVVATVTFGQVSWVLLVPVTLAWLAVRENRWTRAGWWLGVAVAFKPFLAVFLPYLAAKRQTRACAAALLVASFSLVAGIAAFGLESYRSWVATLGRMNWAFSIWNGSLLGLLTRIFDGSGRFQPIVHMPALVMPLWMIGAGVVLFVTFAVALRGACPVDRACALLLVGSLLASPLGWIYYLVLALGPIAALAGPWLPAREVPKVSRPGVLLLAWAGLGCMWPPQLLRIAPRHAWATASFASAYFWGMLGLWLALLIVRARPDAQQAAQEEPSA